MATLLHILSIVVGFGLLIWGADKFVAGAAGLARTLNVSSLIIGLVIVGFGTSAPELLVSGVAAWEGNSGLSIGNALGSNITNIGLVLGTTAMIAPLTVQSSILKREFPVLFLIMAVSAVLLIDAELNRIDGAILLLGFFGFIFWMIHLGKQSRDSDPLQKEFEQEMPESLPIKSAIMWLIIGLLVLLLGARAVVWGAVSIAELLGISDLVIGLTIVAIGTSLPELATTVMSARKGEDDIAIGNIIGSNMFNLLGVLGLPGLIHPDVVDNHVLSRDMPIMFMLTIALFLMARSTREKQGQITRLEGTGLALAYFAYIGLLYFQETALTGE